MNIGKEDGVQYRFVSRDDAIERLIALAYVYFDELQDEGHELGNDRRELDAAAWAARGR
jgi:hypothetical protein